MIKLWTIKKEGNNKHRLQTVVNSGGERNTKLDMLL